MFIQFIKKIIHTKNTHTGKTPLLLRATELWHGALVVALVGVCAIAGFSFLLYQKIQNDEAFVSPVVTTSLESPIKETQLESVLQEFSTKASLFDTYKNNPPSIVDPSL